MDNWNRGKENISSTVNAVSYTHLTHELTQFKGTHTDEKLGRGRQPKRNVYGVVGGMRWVGRPRRRWLQEVEADLARMGDVWQEEDVDRDKQYRKAMSVQGLVGFLFPIESPH